MADGNVKSELHPAAWTAYRPIGALPSQAACSVGSADGIEGYSPLAMAKNAVGLAIATEEYGAKFFANDAAPGGVLEHPGVLKNPDKVRESWNKLFRGSANSHQIAVLEEGLKYQPIGISPEQAQFLETRKFQINEIARIFRVPPGCTGD